MEKSNQAQSSYTAEINKIISFLGRPPSDTSALDNAQLKLDKLAERFQADASLGNERYKLYQAQAMLSYRLNDYVKAKQFIEQSVIIRGSTYELAEQMLQKIVDYKLHKSIKKWVILIVSPFIAFVLVGLLQFVAHFAIAQNSGGGTEGTGSVVEALINILSVLAGIAGIVAIILIPIWIVMLVKTVSYNRGNNGLNKTTVVLLAVFFAFWAWLYTYERDKTKFWVNLALFVVTFTIWGIVAWIWAIIDTASKSDKYYAQYPNYDN